MTLEVEGRNAGDFGFQKVQGADFVFFLLLLPVFQMLYVVICSLMDALARERERAARFHDLLMTTVADGRSLWDDVESRHMLSEMAQTQDPETHLEWLSWLLNGPSHYVQPPHCLPLAAIPIISSSTMRSFTSNVCNMRFSCSFRASLREARACDSK